MKAFDSRFHAEMACPRQYAAAKVPRRMIHQSNCQDQKSGNDMPRDAFSSSQTTATASCRLEDAGNADRECKVVTAQFVVTG